MKAMITQEMIKQIIVAVKTYDQMQWKRVIESFANIFSMISVLLIFAVIIALLAIGAYRGYVEHDLYVKKVKKEIDNLEKESYFWNAITQCVDLKHETIREELKDINKQKHREKSSKSGFPMDCFNPRKEVIKNEDYD